MFIDRVVIDVQAGRGGDGRVSFLREKYRPKGGPDGGDGGDGGSIVLVVSPGRMTLRDVGHLRRYKADDGAMGGHKNMAGRGAEDVEIVIPPGTLVYAGEEEDPAALVADLTEPGQRFVLARGGKGGKGNARFATAINQAPRVATAGEAGQKGRYRLELKLLAEVGLVGLPNAGKSTFLGRTTGAKPKVANYPFTTLHPHLGLARLPDGRELIVADIPGLIEGASQGRGLGDEFLRHVERTRVLLHLVDGVAPETGGLDPVDAWTTIRRELAAYKGADLSGKPEVVALNKADALAPEVARERAEALSQACGAPVAVISAVSGRGCDELLGRLRDLLDSLPAPPRPEAADGFPP